MALWGHIQTCGTPLWQGDGVRSTLFFKDLSERYEKITDNRNGFQMTPEVRTAHKYLAHPHGDAQFQKYHLYIQAGLFVSCALHDY